MPRSAENESRVATSRVVAGPSDSQRAFAAVTMDESGTPVAVAAPVRAPSGGMPPGAAAAPPPQSAAAAAGAMRAAMLSARLMKSRRALGQQMATSMNQRMALPTSVAVDTFTPVGDSLGGRTPGRLHNSQSLGALPEDTPSLPASANASLHGPGVDSGAYQVASLPSPALLRSHTTKRHGSPPLQPSSSGNLDAPPTNTPPPQPSTAALSRGGSGATPAASDVHLAVTVLGPAAAIAATASTLSPPDGPAATASEAGGAADLLDGRKSSGGDALANLNLPPGAPATVPAAAATRPSGAAPPLDEAALAAALAYEAPEGHREHEQHLHHHHRHLSDPSLLINGKQLGMEGMPTAGSGVLGAAWKEDPQPPTPPRTPAEKDASHHHAHKEKILTKEQLEAQEALRAKIEGRTRFAFTACGGRRVDVGRAIKYMLWDVWSPFDVVRMVWDFFMLAMLLYVIFVTPYLVAFDIGTYDLTQPIAAFDLAVNCIFMTDVLLNFRTAFQDRDGRLVFDRKLIAINYLTGWFWLDTLTSLPYDNMISSEYTALKMARAIRILRFLRVLQVLRMLRLLRIARMRVVFGVIDRVLSHNVMRMLVFLLVAFALVHWCACMFYFVARLYGDDVTTWITVQINNGNLPEDASTLQWYIFAVYWSVTTTATVGYGDITGIQIGEKLVSMFTMVVGTSLFAYLMGSMATLIASFNAADVRVTRKKALVNELIKRRKLPRRLGTKIREYFDQVLEKQLHEDEAQIISELPGTLKMQVTWLLHHDALQRMPFFQDKPPAFITAVAPCLKLEFYSPGDIIVRQGNNGHEMFFISTGTVEVRLYDETYDDEAAAAQDAQRAVEARAHSKGGSGMLKRHKSVMDVVLNRRQHIKELLLDEDLTSVPYRRIDTLGPGQYFGEYTCFFGDPRVATVVAVTYCELYALSSHDLERVVAEAPELAQELALLLSERATSVEADILSQREEMGLPLVAHSMLIGTGEASAQGTGLATNTYSNQLYSQSMPPPGLQSYASASAPTYYFAGSGSNQPSVTAASLLGPPPLASTPSFAGGADKPLATRSRVGLSGAVAAAMVPPSPGQVGGAGGAQAGGRGAAGAGAAPPAGQAGLLAPVFEKSSALGGGEEAPPPLGRGSNGHAAPLGRASQGSVPRASPFDNSAAGQLGARALATRSVSSTGQGAAPAGAGGPGSPMAATGPGAAAGRDASVRAPLLATAIRNASSAVGTAHGGTVFFQGAGAAGGGSAEGSARGGSNV